MPWLDKVPAVLQSWYLGTMIGPSMVDVISGKINPSGKLPFSFPKKLEDNGAHHFGEASYPGIEGASAGNAANDLKGADVSAGNDPQQEYLEDIWVGYRWHDTKKIPALFPFGHGLSYTTFSYGKATLSAKEMSADGSLTITVPITNTGSIEGKETVQLYVHDKKSYLPRPLKVLQGLKKVNIAAGPTLEVVCSLTQADLNFLDVKQPRWLDETGKINEMLRNVSTDTRNTVQLIYQTT